MRVKQTRLRDYCSCFYGLESAVFLMRQRPGSATIQTCRPGEPKAGDGRMGGYGSRRVDRRVTDLFEIRPISNSLTGTRAQMPTGPFGVWRWQRAAIVTSMEPALLIGSV